MTTSPRRVTTPEHKGDRRGPFAFDIVPRYWRENGGRQEKLAPLPGTVTRKERSRTYDAGVRSHGTEEMVLSVTSKAFRRSKRFPKRYTLDGENFNPPLEISGVPEGTESLALVMESGDAVSRDGDTKVHWLVWNIPVIGRIGENDVPGCQGINDFGTMFYHGPRPESRTRSYTFRVFALDNLICLPVGARKFALRKALEDHILGYGEFTAVCEKR